MVVMQSLIDWLTCRFVLEYLSSDTMPSVTLPSATTAHRCCAFCCSTGEILTVVNVQGIQYVAPVCVCVRACVCVCVCACVCVCGYGCVASYACLCIGISTGAHAVDVRCVAWTSCIGSPAAGARGECEHSKRGTRVHAAATAAGWAVKCTRAMHYVCVCAVHDAWQCMDTVMLHDEMCCITARTASRHSTGACGCMQLDTRATGDGRQHESTRRCRSRSLAVLVDMLLLLLGVHVYEGIRGCVCMCVGGCAAVSVCVRVCLCACVCVFVRASA